MHNGDELSPLLLLEMIYVLTIYICKIYMSSSLSRTQIRLREKYDPSHHAE